MRSDWKRPSEYSLPAEGEKRIMLTISYDGSLFHGWQAQGNAASVQGTLSEVLSGILGSSVPVFGSGRTDAGVHALRQVCHFDTSSAIDPERFALILNTRLPRSIRVLSSSAAPPLFHARFSTMSREYWYLLKRKREMLPWDDRHIAAVRDFPAIGMLQQYASALAGTHDFTTFASARDPSQSRVRDIYISEWDIIHDGFGFEVLRYRTAGNAFLYHQVRSMVGTMMEAAAAGEGPEAFRGRLEAADRNMALRTAKPDGLYLADVSYDPDRYQWFEDMHGKQE